MVFTTSSLNVEENSHDEAFTSDDFAGSKAFFAALLQLK